MTTTNKHIPNYEHTPSLKGGEVYVRYPIGINRQCV